MSSDGGVSALKQGGPRADQPTMAAFGILRDRLTKVLRSESGIAVPTALMALLASFALASVAVMSSVDVQMGSKRDNGSKNAIAAADAGASVAMLRLNRFQDSLIKGGAQCVGPNGETQTASAGWCPATTTSAVGNANYQYQVSSYSKGGEVNVISTGTSNGVTRRVEVGLVSVNGENVFANERVIGQENIELVGTPDIRTDVGTNGSITGKGSATFCGNIRHGVGKTAPEPDCDGEVKEEDKNLPEVAVPTSFASNCRLTVTCVPSTNVDTYSKSRDKHEPYEENTNKTAAAGAPGFIRVGSNSSLTMGGSDYLVCGLFVGPGSLIMAAKSAVRIFVDTPEHCGLESGATQVEFGGGASITSTGYKPEEGSFAVPNIYVLGDGAVKLNGNSATNELVLYAPLSNIEMGGNSTWIGMIDGKKLEMNGTPKIESDPGMVPPDITLQGLWQRTHYIECTGAGTSPPNAYC
jgi:hypothetical protein